MKPFWYDFTLEDIYKNLLNIEILVNEGKIDDAIQNEFFLNSNSFWLLEKVEQIQKGIETTHGEQDVYEITLLNFQKFYVKIDFISPEKSNYHIIQNMMNTLKYDNTISKNYEKYFEDFKENERIAYIMFSDEEGETKMTEKTGIFSVELFRGIERAVNQSFYENGMDNLRGFIVRVDNSEIKRLNLYKKIIEKLYSQNFPNVFVDNLSEAPKTTLLVATK
jgi:hypothetical protein